MTKKELIKALEPFDDCDEVQVFAIISGSIMNESIHIDFRYSIEKVERDCTDASCINIVCD